MIVKRRCYLSIANGSDNTGRGARAGGSLAKETVCVKARASGGLEFG